MTNNVKGLQSSKKRIKLTGYFKSKLNYNGFCFLQETHRTIKNQNTWVNDRPVFLSQKTDKAGRILTLDIMLDGDHYILINLYNANIETE